MLSQDAGHAVRAAVRGRALGVGIVLTTALVICASLFLATAFSALFLRSYPFQNSERMVMVWESDRETGVERLPMTETAYPVFREQLTAFEGLAYFVPPSHDLPATLDHSSEEVVLAEASPELFPMLGVRAALGRTFSAEENSFGAERVAVLSHGLWMRAFGGRPEVIGEAVRLRWLGERRHYTVVGVMPPDFMFPYPLYAEKPDLWVASQQVPRRRFRSGHNFYVLGLLKPSVALSVGQNDLDRVAQSLAREHPQEYGSIAVRAIALRAESLRDLAGLAFALVAAGILVVGVGLANLLHLMMTRTIFRTREFATRLALGASRASILRLIALECAFLLLAGSALGLLAAKIALNTLPDLLPLWLRSPASESVLTDAASAGIALAVALVITCAISLAMWLLLAKRLVPGQMSGGAASVVGTSMLLKRAGTLALLGQLTAACALMTVSLGLVGQVRLLLDDGSRLSPTSLLSLDISFLNDAPPSVLNDLASFRQDLRRTREVVSAAFADSYPLASALSEVRIGGDEGVIPRAAEIHVVTPSLSEVFDVQMVDGRWFDSNGTDGEAVAVINEAMARHYFSGVRAIGKRMRSAVTGRGPVEWEIIGVVDESFRPGRAASMSPAIYLSWDQFPRRDVTVLVRTNGDARQAAALVRDRALAILPGLTQVRRLQTGTDVLATSTQSARFVGRQLSWLSALAAILACAGLYGTVAFRTSLRTREIAVRRAVGSTSVGILLLILRGTGLVLGGGIVMGWATAAVLNRALTTFHYYDGGWVVGLPYLQTGGLLFAIGLSAALLPAFRAASIDPAPVLRSE